MKTHLTVYIYIETFKFFFFCNRAVVVLPLWELTVPDDGLGLLQYVVD